MKKNEISIYDTVILDNKKYYKVYSPYGVFDFILKFNSWNSKRKDKNFNGYWAMIDPFKLKILSQKDLIPEKLFKHENTHIEQVKRDGKFKFLIKYIWYLLRYGYKNNPYEVEARQAEQ